MELGQYTVEVLGVADQLGLMLKGPLKAEAFLVMERHGSRLFDGMGGADGDRAARLLGQGPAQRDRTLGRLGGEAAAALVMRARYLALRAHRSMLLADNLTFVVGMSYRGAAERAARMVMDASIEPTLADVLPGWGVPPPVNPDADGPDFFERLAMRR